MRYEREPAPINCKGIPVQRSKDRSELIYNKAPTLRGIPVGAFEYRLGNRSALEWVIDQYHVSTDARVVTVNDPNRAEDERDILCLIGEIITVSRGPVDSMRSSRSLNFAG